MEKMSRKQENNKEKNIFGMDGMPPPPPDIQNIQKKVQKKRKLSQGSWEVVLELTKSWQQL